MSEYQYFAFQAIDKPLTREQMAELRRYSTRAEITSTGFVNEYQWGNFKGNPRRWMEQYFDVFLHYANWGTHWLMFRLPSELLTEQTIRRYASEDVLEVWQANGNTIVSFSSDTEEPDWEENPGSLAALVPLRAALIGGDLRSLYLAWLSGIADAEDEGLEPSVPPGLAQLDATHQALADFLRVDQDLLAVAAEHSAPLAETRLDRDAIGHWVQTLTPTEKDRLLTDLLLSARAHPLAALRQRVERELRATTSADSVNAERRTAAALWTRAQTLTRERREREARERAAAKARQEAEALSRRRLYLQTLRGREDQLWQTIDSLIDARQPSRYGQAVSKLLDLRDLAALDRQSIAFSERMGRLREKHDKKPALIRRFREAGLLD